MDPDPDDFRVDWERGSVPFKFQLGDVVLAQLPLTLYRRSAGLEEDQLGPTDIPRPPPSLDNAAGYLVRSQPIVGKLPTLRIRSGAIVYVPRQYRRFSIDLTGGFTAYMARFSGKTRS